MEESVCRSAATPERVDKRRGGRRKTRGGGIGEEEEGRHEVEEATKEKEEEEKEDEAMQRKLGRGKVAVRSLGGWSKVLEWLDVGSG